MDELHGSPQLVLCCRPWRILSVERVQGDVEKGTAVSDICTWAAAAALHISNRRAGNSSGSWFWAYMGCLLLLRVARLAKELRMAYGDPLLARREAVCGSIPIATSSVAKHR